ncbi:MAG: hypothetical protein ACKVT0_04425 [Planctomycetaceae bacterium]
MKLRLIRFVIATLEADEIDWSPSPHVMSDITVKPFGMSFKINQGNQSSIVLEASRCCESLPVMGNDIMVPAELRREMEQMLESHVNVLSILNQCKRSMCSPNPYVAVEPLDEDAEIWLNGKRIRVELSNVPARVWRKFEFAKFFPYLSDRLDGAALLAESMGHSHPTGRFHELMRLFERAFGSSAGRICRNELPKFLEPNGKGYCDTEVLNWLDLRDSTSHADRRPVFALQADTGPIVNRVEQAAYDVLFNKDKWRDQSWDRREVYQPYCGSSGNDSSIFVTKGQPAKLKMTILDGFHAYPHNLKAQLRSIPSQWLIRTTADDIKPKT